MFAPEGGLNALQGSLVRAEHVVGLRERMGQNTMICATTAEGKVVGFVEVQEVVTHTRPQPAPSVARSRNPTHVRCSRDGAGLVQQSRLARTVRRSTLLISSRARRAADIRIV